MNRVSSHRFAATARPLVVAGILLAAMVVGLATSVSSVGFAAEGHADGNHVEIGHNPPAGMKVADFESPAEFRRDLAIWSVAVFLLLLGLLTKFAWKPIMQGLEKREQGIADLIATTQAANEDARQMLASYERRLAVASDEVRSMLDEARRDADVTRQAIIAEARKAAEEEQARAKQAIGLARDDALSQIAEKAGDLAVEVAGKFLREKLGKDDHARLVRDSTASVSAKHSMN
ncbi:MAG: F0F1 ATP synthase subunit B [Planctomycetia bacterium]|nr:F0F1 ATP synthase subunit B [Planctomycetia bacterium]